MIFIANFLVAVVAALHVFFLVLEMFLWDQAAGPEDLPQLNREGKGLGGAGRQPGPV